MTKPISASIEGQRPTARAALASGGPPPRALYIHVPFCFHKCHYCDFYSIVDTGDRHEAFLRTLLAELRTLAPYAPQPLKTIFVGGGTPTLLAPALWEELLWALDELFDLSEIRRGGEFTVECNPETASPQLFDTLVAGGVNRLSIGAQSFNPVFLNTLERWHDPASVPLALELAARAGIRRRSIDLIYAVPGQTLRDWDADLRTALALDPGVDHLSCYALTYEPNTPMTVRLGRGEFDAADEDLEADLFEHTVTTLAEAGFRRYEVSNFAKDTAEGGPCAHNLGYWRGESWLAAGPAAAGHVRTSAGGWRWTNTPRLSDWETGVRACGLPPVVNLEPPDPRRALAEDLMLGLRLAEGVGAVAERAEAVGAGDAMAKAVASQRDLGLLEERGGRLVLTDAGWLVADGVASALMQALDGRGAV